MSLKDERKGERGPHGGDVSLKDARNGERGPHGAARSFFAMMAAAVALSLAACGGDKAGVKADTKPEPSDGVKASINAKFVDPNLDVQTWTKRFEREHREVFKHRSAIVTTLGLREGSVVADIGAGTGAFTAELAQRVGAQGRVFALEISPKFVEHLEARVASEGLTQVTVKLSEPDDVTLAASSVDVAFLCDTYHHLEHPPLILATIFAALKPGGRLVIVDFHRIPGKTRQWLLEHVRAGQEVFAKEITDAGFERLPDPPHDFLVENYLMVFKRP